MKIVLGIELILNCCQEVILFGIEYSKYGIALSVCSEGLWRALESSGGLWRALEGSGGLWRAMKGSEGL